jgi:cytochrome P450
VSTPVSGRPPEAPSGFNPISQEFLNDPERWLEPARRERPVFFVPEFELWAITRHADVERALTDWRTFSSASLAFVPVPDEFADRVPPGFFASGALASQDPPQHTARRKLINPGFSRGRMAAMVEPIERICHELIDAFAAEGACELMRGYCYEVSLRSIVHLMGVPTDELPRLRQLAQDLPAVVSDGIKPMADTERAQRWERIVQARSYLAEVAEQRRHRPGDDLVSVMVSARDADGQPVLTPDEVVTHLSELIMAGTDTTANLMGSMVRLLDAHPDQRDEVLADPALWPQAVEEGLRARSPANGIFRVATRDVEVAGVTIPAGAIVWLGVASAGYDATVVDDPQRFDIHRQTGQHRVSFGKGRHFCMGAPLTRVEAPIGLRVLYERLPGLRVTSGQTFRYDPVLIAGILEQLQVEWDTAG